MSRRPEKCSVTAALLSLFCVVLVTIIGFAVVTANAPIEAIIAFTRDNWTIVLAGGCAFYVLLFWLSLTAFERILRCLR